MSDTIMTQDNIEIYINNMHIWAKEYKDSLDDPDILKSTTGYAFTGLIKYISRHLNITKDLYSDLDLLNTLWYQYTDLVYEYNQKPTIEEYALMIGISRDTIYSWLKGETRDDLSAALGSSRSDTIKKWQSECALGRYKSAASGNVGGIFLCKAVDGMVETAPVLMANEVQGKSLEQIAAEHVQQITDNAAPAAESSAAPELPDV